MKNKIYSITISFAFLVLGDNAVAVDNGQAIKLQSPSGYVGLPIYPTIDKQRDDDDCKDYKDYICEDRILEYTIPGLPANYSDETLEEIKNTFHIWPASPDSKNLRQRIINVGWDGLDVGSRKYENKLRLCLGARAYREKWPCMGKDFSDDFKNLYLWYNVDVIITYIYVSWVRIFFSSNSGDEYGVIGSGSAVPTIGPPSFGKLPDFITSKVTMGNKDGNHEKYTWKINETAYVHDYIDNIGTADWEGKAKKIKVPFYLSKGTKEDSHSEWVRVSRQEIKKEHLKVKDKPKHEYIKFNLAEWANDSTVLPGRTYNFVVCADRPKDENNGDGDVKEKHKSNNCSTEAVFYVDFGPARNVDLIADNLALTGGRTELQAGEKYGLQVEVSNIGTEQPWNGFRTKYEIKGPGTGGVWQKIGDEHSKASSLYAGAIHFESMTGDDEVSAPMVGGDYVFRACADYEQVVPETDESNNCSAELPVTVIAPPPPAACVILNPLASLPATGSFDLAATSIEFPDTVQQGDEMHPKAQVCGVSGTSPKTRATWAYANCDGTGFTAFDGDTDDGLSAGECVTEENKEGDDLANMPPGRYVMYFIANGETQVPESDHSNNVQAKEFVVE